MPSFWKKNSHPVADKKPGWAERLRNGLSKTRAALVSPLTDLFSRPKVNEAWFEELETILLTADTGVEATQFLLDELRVKARRNKIDAPDSLRETLLDTLTLLLAPLEKPLVIDDRKPFVIMLTGVNGAGKTTSIGKLAKYFQSQGKSVLLAAGDTFRAAAREQLVEWGHRNNVAVIAAESGDAAAVIFDAVQAARARNIDIVLADTAGRLPTQPHLMDEIKKIKRVIGKAMEGAPHETLLVLDANTGQNAVSQVTAFNTALNITGLVLTKLDGTAKGGVIAAIARNNPIPLRFIGIGEGIDDLKPFAAREFVESLFD